MWRTVTSWVGYPIVLAVIMALAAIPAALAGGDDEADSPLNQFRITSFTADYVLDRHRDGTTDVIITEEIVADFRRPGVNRGIVRAIPLRYQDHRNTVTEISVTGDIELSGWSRDPEDKRRTGDQPFTTVVEDGVLLIRIGDHRASLARGTQRWSINYRLGDVALNTPDRAKQEIYLDANGTAWAVPFDRVTARLHVPADLAERLDGTSACYRGAEGARDTCQVTVAPGPVTESGPTTVFTATTGALDRRESLTFAVGFVPDTFPVAYTPRPDPPAVPWWPFVLPVIGLLLYLPPLIRSLRNSRVGRPEVVVTEYLPPQDVPALAAADIMGEPAKGPTAQLLELIVAGVLHLRITDAGPERPGGPPQRLGWLRARRLQRSLWIPSDDFDRIPDADIRSLMEGWFGHDGFRYRPDPSTAADLVMRQHELMARRRWREPGPPPFRGVLGWFALLAIVGAILMLVIRPSGTDFWLLLASGVVGVLFLIAAVHRHPGFGRLTESGRRVRDQLHGLKRFITMAEADRIAWLQGVESAPRVSPEDHEALVKLYEPLLPYAVIFGAEKSWVAVLGEHRAAVNLPPVAPELASLGIDARDLVRLLDHGGQSVDFRSHGGVQGFTSANDSVHSFGETLADFATSDNDGGGSSGSRGGGTSSSGWSSGGSSGGGRSGGGMGGGGGGGW